MSSLAPEILLKIFSFLSQSTLFNVIQVSKYWNSIAITLLWREFRCTRKRPYYASILKTHGSFIRDVEFQGVYVEDDDVQLMIDTCNNITSAKFNMARVTAQGIAILCEKLSEQLECLFLNSCYRIKGILPYITTIKKLKRLELQSMWYIDDVACGMIVAQCQLLEVINFGSTDITDVGVGLIAQHLPHLRTLNLRACQGITDASLFALTSARCRKTITDLDILFCDDITDTGVRRVVTLLPHLQRLILGGCSSLTNGLFDEPLWQCTELAELDIDSLNVGSSALLWISNLTSLTSLTASSLNIPASENPESFKLAIVSLAKLPNLRILDLSDNKMVDDDLVKKIAKRCALTDLILSRTEASDACIEGLSNLYPNVRIRLE